MLDIARNFAVGTVATNPTGTGGTSLALTAGHGARFGAPMNATLWDSGTHANAVAAFWAGAAEIVRITGIATDTLTIVRAQEGTTARDFAGLTCTLSAGITADSYNRLAIRGLSSRRAISRVYTHGRWDGMTANSVNGGTVDDVGSLAGAAVRLKFGSALKLKTGTTTNGEASLSTSGWNHDIDDWYGWLASDFAEFSGVMTFRIPTLSDVANTFAIWIGFGTDIAAATAKSRFAGVRINGSVIEIAAKNNGALTLGAGGTVAENTEHHIRISYRPGVSVEAWLDGTYLGILSAGFSPTNTRRLWAVKILKSAGTTLREIQIGPHGYENILT